MKNSQGNFWRIVATVGAVGMEVIILTVGGAWLGQQLDAVWNTKPIMLAVGLFIGLGLGFTSAALTFKALLKE
ncbi:AtpZ/AtpI family protein [Thermoflavimicrobium dichotomicum]|nr:AtpZ/AtpI family protein [Thermoflavimicrobium dichotomicum]